MNMAAATTTPSVMKNPVSAGPGMNSGAFILQLLADAHASPALLFP